MEKGANLQIKKSGNTLFQGSLAPYPTLTLHVNIPKLKNTFISCIGPLKYFRHKETGEEKAFFEIGKCKNPSSITLGHELIHAIHYLEDHTRYRTLITTEEMKRTGNRTREVVCARRDGSSGIISRSIDQCLWNSDEEQITVLGEPERLWLSETQLRLDHALSPRYPYKTDAYFYEDATLIAKLLHEHVGDAWYIRLTSIFKTGWEFNQEEAITSHYNSVDMSQYDEVG